MVKAPGEGGRADHALLLVRDVTEQREAERRLRESEQRLSLLIQSTPLGVIQWRLDFTVESWNPGAAKIFGYPASEAVGRHASLIIPASRRAEVDAMWRELAANRGGFRSSGQNL